MKNWLDLFSVFFGDAELPTRTAISFEGGGVSCEDDATNKRTRVTIPEALFGDEDGVANIGATELDAISATQRIMSIRLAPASTLANGANTVWTSPTMPTSEVWIVKSEVLLRTSFLDACLYQHTWMVKNTAGTVTVTLLSDPPFIFEDQPDTAAIDLTVSGTTVRLVVTADGASQLMSAIVSLHGRR